MRTWYFFCFACLYWQRLGILHARTYLGHHHRRISLSARAVQQRLKGWSVTIDAALVRIGRCHSDERALRLSAYFPSFMFWALNA